MSADGSLGPARRAVPRAAFSLALIAVAGWVAFKGVQFARMGAIEWEIERGRGVDQGAILQKDQGGEAQARERREMLARWRDVEGLRDKARLLYFGIGQRQLEPPSPLGLDELAAVIAVDPVRSTSWMDLAQMTWSDLSLRPVSLAAWEMSALTGPYEYADMLRRVQFLARRWVSVEAEQKQRFAYEVVLMSQFPDPFLPAWRTLLASLPAPQRERMQDEMEAASPLYRR